MDTRNLSLGSRWLVAAGLSIIVALSGCGDPGTNVGDEKKKADNALKTRSDLNTIKNADDKAAGRQKWEIKTSSGKIPEGWEPFAFDSFDESDPLLSH